MCQTAFFVLVGLCIHGTDSIAEEVRQRDLVYVPSGEPHLRINVNGHTSSVRSLAFTPDSARLCSGGWDKVVQVWNLRAATRDLQGVYTRERTIRWQVARGPLGNINTVAISPSDGLLAFGGNSAMGALGEIWLVDPVQGTLQRVLDAHRQSICSLAFSADGAWLASMDTDGQAVLWRRGEWKPIVVHQTDEKAHGVPAARDIRKQTSVRPLVIAGSSHVVLPTYAGQDAAGRPTWKLERVRLDNPADRQVFETVHYGMVSALAVTPDGSRLASADLQGKLHLWDLRSGAVQPLIPGATVMSLAFSPDGRTLLVGTAQSGGSGTAQLQVWDVEQPAFRRRQVVADHVLACAVSPDGKRIAYTGGKDFEVFVEPLQDAKPRVSLGGKAARVLKVAFAKDPPYYRVAFGTDLRERGFNDYGVLGHTFDTQRLELGREGPVDAAQWLTGDHGSGGWEAVWQNGSLHLRRGGQAKGIVTLDSALKEGEIRSYCWIPGRDGQPVAIAVGADLQNSIYVCRLAEQGVCPILRHFRGHNDTVLSLAVSRDLRFLVSGSADGTVAFWNLADYDQGETPWGRWGAEFAVVKAGAAFPATRDLARKAFAKEDQLVVSRVNAAGPLYRKGVHAGDVIKEIRWFSDQDGQKEQRAARPEAILQSLRQMPWGTLVEFRYARDNGQGEWAAREGFLLRPAWQPLATLFVGSDREWAFWTPEGYFDASANGYTLFGWQVNRGMRSLPAFYRADQFYRNLEQPSVLERLLPAGSLKDAFDQAQLRPQGELQNAAAEQISRAPTIEILQPLSDAEVQGNVAKVRAKIQVPLASQLVQAKIYASGVVGTQRVLVGQKQFKTHVEQTYEWQVALPAEEINLIQVVAATNADVTAADDLRVRRVKPVLAERPKMYVLAVGINQYADPRVPPLEFSAADAQAVRDVLKTRADPLYDVVLMPPLLNADVTPEKWRRAIEELKDRLKARVSPDDLLVLFLAGHGWEDVKTRQYYFIGHDFKMANLGKSYAGCLSWDDFRLLNNVPCRKLALLDTCHSGAIQPPRLRNMKAALRQLQDDVIFTVTASQGDQLAAENPEWKHGVFTKCLIEALEGRTDVTTKRDVTLSDVVRHVQETVPRITSELTQGAKTQQPTAAPIGLLQYARIPLTRIEERSQRTASTKTAPPLELPNSLAQGVPP